MFDIASHGQDWPSAVQDAIKHKIFDLKFCKSCKEFFDHGHFKCVFSNDRKSKIKYTCKINNKIRQDNYIANHLAIRRYRSLICKDIRRELRGVPLLFDQYNLMINQPCFYCKKLLSGGIDRMDNSIGHTLSNCVPCCEKCNIILGDIPFEAKKLLSDGLSKIHNNGLLDQWNVPYKR